MSTCENVNRGTDAAEIQSPGSSMVVPDGGKRRCNGNKYSTTVTVDSNTLILLQASASFSMAHQLHPVVDMPILFNSGSQRSYLSKRKNAKLNLLLKRKEKLLIM